MHAKVLSSLWELVFNSWCLRYSWFVLFLLCRDGRLHYIDTVFFSQPGMYIYRVGLGIILLLQQQQQCSCNTSRIPAC